MERLPLRTLLPEGIAAGATLAVAIAEAYRHDAVLHRFHHSCKELVGRSLILETVSYLMGNGGTHGLAGAGIHPKGTNHVVIARPRGQPLGLIEQEYLHLVLIEHRFALAHRSHTELLDIGFIELLGLLQQVVHIHTQGLGHRFGIGIGSKTGLPKHEEVLTRLITPPRPLGIGTQHALRPFLKAVVPCTWTVEPVVVGNLGLVHRVYGIGVGFLMHSDD